MNSIYEIIKIKKLYFKVALIIILVVYGCKPHGYTVNKYSSSIGLLNTKCIKDSTFNQIQNKYSIDLIVDKEFNVGLKLFSEYYRPPEYLIYFNKEPKELVGFNSLAVKAVYNPSICTYEILNGNSVQLSDEEQMRIRNRVQEVIMEFQCLKGKKESEKLMKSKVLKNNEGG